MFTKRPADGQAVLARRTILETAPIVGYWNGEGDCLVCGTDGWTLKDFDLWKWRAVKGALPPLARAWPGQGLVRRLAHTPGGPAARLAPSHGTHHRRRSGAVGPHQHGLLCRYLGQSDPLAVRLALEATRRRLISLLVGAHALPRCFAITRWVFWDVDRVVPKRVTFSYERVCEPDSRV